MNCLMAGKLLVLGKTFNPSLLNQAFLKTKNHWCDPLIGSETPDESDYKFHFVSWVTAGNSIEKIKLSPIVFHEKPDSLIL